jgi:hypothetical protein
VWIALEGLRVESSEREVYEAYLDHWGVLELGEFERFDFGRTVDWRSVYSIMPRFAGVLRGVRRGEDLWTGISHNLIILDVALNRSSWSFRSFDGKSDVRFVFAAFNLSKTQALIAANDESLAPEYGCVIHHTILMERTAEDWRVVWRR